MQRIQHFHVKDGNNVAPMNRDKKTIKLIFFYENSTVTPTFFFVTGCEDDKCHGTRDIVC